MRVIDDLLQRTPTRPLFHYTDAAGLCGILKSGAVWATSANHLNDAQEYRYGIKLIVDLLRDRLNSERGPLNEAYREMLAGMKDYPEDVQAFIASFSEEGDLLSQWLAYPGSINGYAICFKDDHFTTARNSGFELIPCVYEVEEQKRLANAIIDAISGVLAADMSHSNAETPLSDESKSAITRKAILAAAAMKHPGFEREGEWRLVKTSIIGWEHADEVLFRSGRCGVVPYMAAPLKWTGTSSFLRRSVSAPMKICNLQKRLLRAFSARGTSTVFYGLPSRSRNRRPHTVRNSSIQ